MVQVSVETSQFGTAAAKLDGIEEGMAGLNLRLSTPAWFPANGWLTISGPQLGVISLEAQLLAGGMQSAAAFAGAAAEHLLQAQAWYEAADRAAVEAFTALSDAVVSTVVLSVVSIAATGALAAVPLLLSPAGIPLVLGTLATAGALEQAGVLPGGDDIVAWWDDNQHLLANPLSVLLVRSGVSAGDEIVNGLTGVPLFTSPNEVAGALAATFALGTGPMLVSGAKRDEASSAPSSIADLVEAIPPTDPDGTNATITEYVRPDGSTVYVVSVAGTSSPGLGDENGMDNLSNLAAYGGSDAQSVGAVSDAMGQAGITAGDEVVFVGYSQGALVVSELAKTGTWDVASVVLAGSPVHGTSIGGEIPVTQLEHDGDLITGLQGITPGAQGDVSVVRRDPFPSGVPAGEGILAPHALAEYQQTAAGYDEVDDPKAVTQRDAVLAPVQGATAVTTTDFRFEREPVYASGGGIRPMTPEEVFDRLEEIGRFGER